MSWYLSHCFVGASCSRGSPLIAGSPTVVRDFLRRHRSEPTCEKDLGLGLGESMRRQIGLLLASRGFEDGSSSRDGSPWLWCLGGSEVYRQLLSEEDQLDLQPDSCVDLTLYVCETHMTISAQIDRNDAVPEWGGSGPEDPRQSDPIPLGDSGQVVDAAMALLTSWFDHEVISPAETR